VRLVKGTVVLVAEDSAASCLSPVVVLWYLALVIVVPQVAMMAGGERSLEALISSPELKRVRIQQVACQLQDKKTFMSRANQKQKNQT
jgi:hypothetical protein